MTEENVINIHLNSVHNFYLNICSYEVSFTKLKKKYPAI
jgi:hypothetical protein